jgi:hypothetical protein
MQILGPCRHINVLIFKEIPAIPDTRNENEASIEEWLRRFDLVHSVDLSFMETVSTATFSTIWSTLSAFPDLRECCMSRGVSGLGILFVLSPVEAASSLTLNHLLGKRSLDYFNVRSIIDTASASYFIFGKVSWPLGQIALLSATLRSQETKANHVQCTCLDLGAPLLLSSFIPT